MRAIGIDPQTADRVFVEKNGNPFSWAFGARLDRIAATAKDAATAVHLPQSGFRLWAKT
jgi:hypothetical protein